MFLRAGLGEVLEYGQVADGKEVGEEERDVSNVTDADRQSNKGNNNGEEQE